MNLGAQRRYRTYIGHVKASVDRFADSLTKALVRLIHVYRYHYRVMPQELYSCNMREINVN